MKNNLILLERKYSSVDTIAPRLDGVTKHFQQDEGSEVNLEKIMAPSQIEEVQNLAVNEQLIPISDLAFSHILVINVC